MVWVAFYWLGMLVTLTKPLQVTMCTNHHPTSPTTFPESFSLIGPIPMQYTPSWNTDFTEYMFSLSDHFFS